jgi:ferrochelatase
MTTALPCDALLFVAFGGPEGPDDVLPFLENVTRGRSIPRERLLEVAGHYQHFGGISPLNQQVRDLMAAVEPELRRRAIDVPLYWGNRNWHPLLADTVVRMRDDGVQRALAFVLSAYSSYSGCRQYRENIAAAREAVGEGAPAVEKIRMFYNHPDFIAASVDRIQEALSKVPPERRRSVHVAYTAHSIPAALAQGCDYVKQLTETGRLIAEAVSVPPERRQLVFQSRSGRPQDPWLDPDIVEHLRTLRARNVTDVVVAPIGFLSDHLEVLYDLDHEAADAARALGLHMVRAATVGTHPRFVAMIGKLVEERLRDGGPREASGEYGPSWDVCPVDCCPPPVRGGPR